MKETVTFSKDAANLFFHILTGCNLRCRHCYINPDQHGTQTLPIKTIEAWLEVFARRSHSANVIFLGGEPTLHPDLPQAVQTARNLGYRSITIDTNGYLFHDILDKLSPQDIDYFSFSLDGATAAVNDRIRGDGAFRQCTDGIRDAVSRGFHTSLIFTVSRDNIHELPLMPSFLEELGIERFFIQVLGLRGQSAGVARKDRRVSRAEWLESVHGTAEAAVDLGIVTVYPKVFLDLDEPFECAGRVADNYFVFPNGRVYRCPLCEDHPVHSLRIEEHQLFPTEPINEKDLFALDIPEGCVMNKLIQPDNLAYNDQGDPEYKIACCLLKEELRPK